MRGSWLAMIVMGICGCGGTGTGRCVPGATSACACSDGEMGAQSCQPDGTFGSCDCGSGSSNSHNTQPPNSSSPPAGAKRVFVTSGTYDGMLGGVIGADQLCQQAADGAALGGTWKSWLSTSSVDAIDRIAAVGPWYTTGGALAFENHASLGSTAAHAIDRDERGNAFSGAVEAWTGTGTGGRGSSSCEGWSVNDQIYQAEVGSAADGADWTAYQLFPCDLSEHLYCFEQ